MKNDNERKTKGLTSPLVALILFAIVGWNSAYGAFTPHATLSATVVSTTQVNLSWTSNAVPYISSWTLQRREVSPTFTAMSGIAVLKNIITSYIDTSYLSAATTYDYQLMFLYGGNRYFSNIVEVTTLPYPPAAPSGLSATSVSSTQISLTWTDNSSNETAFNIERSNGVDGNFSQVATVGTNVTSYSDSGLTAGTIYFYRVRASNAGGYSGYSNEATSDVPPTVAITAPSPNAVYATPANIVVSANASDSDGTVAQVDFFDGPTAIGTVTAPPYSVQLSNVAAGTHVYTARATDNLGVATSSTAVSVTVDASPTVSLAAPASNSVFAVPVNISLSATAADTLGNITKVDFYEGTTLIGTSTTSPYSVTWTDVPIGTYSLTAVVTNDAGTTATSAAVMITVTPPGPQLYSIYPDQLNTPRLIANASGAVMWRWDQGEPFGNDVPNGDPNNTGFVFDFPMRFPGQYFDQETNLAYNYYRDYDSSVGRYVQSDPIGLEGGIDTYTYVGQNPLNYIDPLGLLLTCTQVRYGTNTTVTCYDSTDQSTTVYNLSEPANNGNPNDPYGPNGQLPPGQYDLLPRLAPGGPVLPTDAPLYTTPGEPVGTVVAPNGQLRYLIGPHVGTRSLGCPLFPPTAGGRKQRDDFYKRFLNNVNQGGTSVTVQ